MRVGIIGGSGLYHLEELEATEEIHLETPFGKPSSSFVTGEIHGVPVARHRDSVDFSCDKRRGGFAERRLKVNFFCRLQFFQVIKTAAADDSYSHGVLSMRCDECLMDPGIQVSVPGGSRKSAWYSLLGCMSTADAMRLLMLKNAATAPMSQMAIWDIGAVAAFFNMSNRMASAVDMQPNKEYHALFREPPGTET